MFELLHEIEIPKYIRTYTKSKSMRPSYFEKGKKKLPLVYCNIQLYENQGVREPDGINYYWDKFKAIKQGNKTTKEYLVEAKTGQRVLFNAKNVGKAKIANINGQGILSGNIRSFEKDKMLGEIKDYVRPFVANVPPIQRFPLRLILRVYDTRVDTYFSGGQRWDLENRFIPYAKAIHDLIAEDDVDRNGNIIRHRLIPDDNVDYITGPMQPLFYPIENPEERKLVLAIFKDNRPEILNDLEYQFIHKEKLK